MASPHIIRFTFPISCEQESSPRCLREYIWLMYRSSCPHGPSTFTSAAPLLFPMHLTLHATGPDLSHKCPTRHLKVQSSKDTCEGVCVAQKHNELERQPSLLGLLQATVRPHFVRPCVGRKTSSNDGNLPVILTYAFISVGSWATCCFWAPSLRSSTLLCSAPSFRLVGGTVYYLQLFLYLGSTGGSDS